jgi:hypothetical protein
MSDTAVKGLMRTSLFAIAGVAAALAAGCASGAARTSAAVPLDIPEPPAKVAIAPVPAPEMPPDRPVAAVAEDNPPISTPPSRPTQARGQPAAAVAQPSSGPPAGPLPVPEPTTPAPELRPAGSAAKALGGTQVREALDRARQKLDAIDRRRLNAGKRADYDSARRFLAAGDAAVKANNLMLAQSSAEKAEALADGLR